MDPDAEVKMHNQMRTKVIEIFSKGSHINDMSEMEACLIIWSVALLPLITGSYHLLVPRVTLACVYFGLRKMKLSILIFGTCMFMSSTLLDYENNLLEFRFLVAFHLVLFNRLKVDHARQIAYSIVCIYLAMSLFLEQFRDYGLTSLIYVICMESTIWRDEYYLAEYHAIQSELEGEIDSIKSQHINEMMILQSELESRQYLQSTSRANELLKKLRLMKYQALIQKNDKVQKKLLRKSSIRSNKRIIESEQKPHTSLRDIGDEICEDLPNVTSSQKLFQGRKDLRMMSSLTECRQDQSIVENIEHSFSSGKHNQEQISMQVEDIDDLLNLLSGKKDPIWLPRFLRSSKTINNQTDHDEFSNDARRFLLSHFTQRESSFKYIDEIDERQHNPHEIDFNTDFMHFTIRQFMDTAMQLFQVFNVALTLKIQPDTIRDFCIRIHSLYLNNLYHNAQHALDVTNSACYFLQNGLLALIDDFDACCLIVSSLAHDLGHPGLNNGFAVANQTKLALLFNDQSVLENYHTFLLFQVLQQDEYNITKNLTPTELKGFRKYCLTLILDTDLTKHFQLMNRFTNYLELSETTQTEQNKMLIMSIAIKCADVGHGAKTLEIHKQWSRRIIEEFFLQGDLEKHLQVPVSPMCDRNQPVTKSQEGFLKAIVLPMFDSFAKLLNKELICQVQIKENIAYWQQCENEQFLKETNCNSQGYLEALKKFLNQPLQINI